MTFIRSLIYNTLKHKNMTAQKEYLWQNIWLSTMIIFFDLTEKEYIDQYDSFRNGYNNTGGNI